MDPLIDETESARQAGHSLYRGKGILGRAETVLMDIGAFSVLVMCFYVVLGIFMRSVVGGQIPDEVVIIGELMIVAVILPLAYVAADRAFIAVEVFNKWIGPRSDKFLHAFAALVGLFATTPIAVAGYNSLVEAVMHGDYHFGQLSLPEWPGRLAFFLGYLVFMIRLLTIFVGELRRGVEMNKEQAGH